MFRFILFYFFLISLRFSICCIPTFYSSHNHQKTCLLNYRNIFQVISSRNQIPNFNNTFSYNRLRETFQLLYIIKYYYYNIIILGPLGCFLFYTRFYFLYSNFKCMTNWYLPFFETIVKGRHKATYCDLSSK